MIRKLFAMFVVLSMMSVLLVPGVSANPADGGDQENEANIIIQGGNAESLALCLNIAAGKYQGTVAQKNRCRNIAYARGGDVHLRNVDIVVDQLNDDTTGGGDQENEVNVVIQGGNATAVAACVNVANERVAKSVNQTNECKNVAKAVGGDVVLKDVTITVVQTNFQ
jgi:hypothetical protein